MSAISDARDALKKVAEAQPGIAQLPELYTRTERFATVLFRARERINAAVGAGNEQKYSASVKSAAQAMADCTAALGDAKAIKASVLKNNLPSDYPRAEQAIALATGERAVAQAALAAAKAGQAGSISGYNAAVKRYDKAVDAADKGPFPEFLDNPRTARRPRPRGAPQRPRPRHHRGRVPREVPERPRRAIGALQRGRGLARPRGEALERRAPRRPEPPNRSRWRSGRRRLCARAIRRPARPDEAARTGSRARSSLGEAADPPGSRAGRAA